MDDPRCRACRGRSGQVVLDLGEQPACDYFPPAEDPGPDPEYQLQMWLCAQCGLAQLAADPTVPEEPRGAEPAALVNQARDAVARVAAAGMLPASATVVEFGSPHGGSWLGPLGGRGLSPARQGEPADLVVDCFGLMHCADQSAALAGRAARVADGGALLLQYHSLDTIVRLGQWNALRHGHFAYYSTTALTAMLADHGFAACTAWRFDLYGGTVLLAARRQADGPVRPDSVVASLLADDARTGVCDPGVLAGLQHRAVARAEYLHDWLAAQRSGGRTVVGYGAASRAVSLLREAKIDAALLSAVVDASPAEAGPAHAGDRHPDRRPGQAHPRHAGLGAAFPPGSARRSTGHLPRGRGGRRSLGGC